MKYIINILLEKKHFGYGRIFIYLSLDWKDIFWIGLKNVCLHWLEKNMYRFDWKEINLLLASKANLLIPILCNLILETLNIMNFQIKQLELKKFMIYQYQAAKTFWDLDWATSIGSIVRVWLVPLPILY